MMYEVSEPFLTNVNVYFAQEYCEGNKFEATPAVSTAAAHFVLHSVPQSQSFALFFPIDAFSSAPSPLHYLFRLFSRVLSFLLLPCSLCFVHCASCFCLHPFHSFTSRAFCSLVFSLVLSFLPSRLALSSPCLSQLFSSVSFSRFFFLVAFLFLNSALVCFFLAFGV